MKKNRGAQYLRGREARMAMQLEGRSEQRVECRYCEVATRKEVTRYASEENRSWRTVPTGYEY